MQKVKRREVLALSLILIISISFCGFEFIKHEKSQEDRIAGLEDRIAKIEDRITSLEGKVNLLQEESNKSSVNWNPDDYNYLAIGNSITIHQLNEYWWNECGMAATTAENDYAHIDVVKE